MHIKYTQNPGVGGLDNLTTSEEAFVMNLAGQAYQRGDILFYNGSALQRLPADNGKYLRSNGTSADPSWESAAGGISGSGTATYVPFFSDATTLTTDAHFTYDSVNDVLHVHKIAGDATDGLIIESANGTDVGILGPANTANVTWYGAHNFDVATASRIASFGASKTLEALSTATYPDLTELSYVKGVTSGIQSQLGSKQATLVSGTNIKTVNGNTLLGSGDVTISSAVAWGAITGTLSSQTDLQTALDGKVDENVAITGATKTKITYDTKGLVTSGADATTADIADSSNKRYVTDAQLTVIGNTSGTNSGDNAANTTSNAYADGKVADAINDGTTTIAPSQNAVFDALALKAPLISPSFTTPSLGVATATSINGATITSGTLNGSVTGTNTGDQTSIVGITGTKAQFNTAVSDGDIVFTDAIGSTVQGYSAVLANTTASFLTADETKLDFITVTQAVNLDTIESDTATNNAKVSNATHTGDVTGSGALTIDSSAITGKTLATALGTDYILISDTSDSGNLKKALLSDVMTGGATNLSYTAATRILASDTGTDATLPLVSSGDAGLAPASGGGTTNFLRADGTWTAPAGGSGITMGAAVASVMGFNRL